MYGDKFRDPKKYWRQIKVRKPRDREHVTLESFKEHFIQLSTSKCPLEYTVSNTYKTKVDILDANFTIDEMERAIKHLKNNKAAGDDYVLSEFIRYAKHNLKYVLLDIFNKLYSTSYYPEQWTTGLIVPIYKKGKKSVPGNYRGITLTSTMSKLFTYMLNQRMLRWSEEYGISTQSQFAYKPGFSTIDAVFVLQNVVAQNMVSSVVFCAFIDFSKAFDTIERNILYQKLVSCGLSLKMLQMIMNMYSKLKSKVKTTKGITEAFPLNVGVMQGECLSPSLFSLYINDIVKCMDNIAAMGVSLSDSKITVLKYADDLVLLSTTSDGLQQGLNELKLFCVENMLTVNTEKSKVMCFTKKALNQTPTLRYGSNVLDWVDDFKYLGVTFSKNNTFVNGLELLCEQARKAQVVLDLHVLKHKTLSVKYILELFDTLVKPILLYGSEVYGINNYKAIDTFYLRYIKHLLNVKPSTNTCMVYAEVGRYPLSIDIRLNMIKQWIKIINSDKEKLIWISYNSMRNSSNSKPGWWTSNIKHLLYSTGFGYVWEQQMVYDDKMFLNQFRERCNDMHIQSCLSDIDKNSRCRLYKHIKGVYEMEQYLQRSYHRDLRQCLTKIRLSSHKFLVERGRWSKPIIEYKQRKCTLCDEQDIEDEYHILMKCPYFKSLRQKYVKKCYYCKPSMFKFQRLMTTQNKRDLYRLMIFIKV